MSAAWALAVSGLVSCGLGVLLGGAIVVRRWLRERTAGRVRRLAEPYRPLVVALVAAAGDAREQQTALLNLDERTWAALEPVVVAMVRKVRGEGREQLVLVLEARGTIERLTRRLRSRRVGSRARSAELLGLLGEHAPRLDLERLVQDDRDPQVRIVAARALGEVGNPASAGVLLAAVAGVRSVPLRVVARSLTRLGPAAAPTLVAALSAGRAPTRAVAAEILGLSGTVTAVGVLSTRMLHDPDDDVRIRCARALGRIGAPSALAVLARVVRPDEPAALRAVAVRAVGAIGGPQAARMLLPLVADGDPRVAGNAARGLAGLGPAAMTELRTVATGGGAGAGYAAEALALAALRFERVDRDRGPDLVGRPDSEPDRAGGQPR